MADEAQPSKGIKESKELLKGLELLCIDAKKVMADGKVNVADLPVLMALMNQLGDLSAAVQGASEIGGELKDLDASELQDLGSQVLSMLAAIKAA